MTSELTALCFEAANPDALGRFWAGILGWTPAADPMGAALVPTDDTGFRLRFLASDAPKLVQNRAHFDLTSSSLADQQRTVERALDLGGRHVDVGQLPEEGHVVLGDPEGNEFCVVEPGNRFLADCGFVGALSCDGSQAVGYFWSAALDYPLVWDQDEETAVRSPRGGPKITWGGPPLPPKPARNRLHLDVVGGAAELERLLALGASRRTDGACVGAVALADPDGNEFCLLPPV